MPTDLSSNAIYDNKPKRSKSLAARLRGGRNGRSKDQDSERETEQTHTVPLNARDANGQYDEDEDSEKAEAVSPLRNGNVRFENEPRYASKGPTSGARFDGGEGITNTRSLGQEGQVDSPALGRRPSVMQRLFSGKKKVSRRSWLAPGGSLTSPLAVSSPELDTLVVMWTCT